MHVLLQRHTICYDHAGSIYRATIKCPLFIIQQATVDGRRWIKQKTKWFQRHSEVTANATEETRHDKQRQTFYKEPVPRR